MRIHLFPVLLCVFVSCTNTPTSPPPPPPSPPPDPPTMTSSTPDNNASGIAVDTNLILTLSKPMDTTSMTVTASPATDLGSRVWSDGDTTLTLDPPANLTPGTTYTITLEGKDKSDKALEGTKTISFTTASAADPPPATPANLSARPGDASVTVSWDANTEPDLKNYTVFWGSSSSALTTSIVVDKTQSSKTIGGLVNGTPYFFALSAKDTAGNESARTATIGATPVKPPPPGDTTPPAVPTKLAVNAGDGEVNLSWKANLEPDLKGYNIYSGTTAGSLTLVGFVDKAGTSKKITGLTNGTAYFFAIDAEDTSGNKSGKTAPVNATPKDMTAPKLISSTPADGATKVKTDGPVIFNFSEPMERVSLALDCKMGVDTPCPSSLAINPSASTWSDNNKTVNVNIDGAFTSPLLYTLIVTARDKAGNALAPTSIHFTSNVPRLVSSTPANGAKDVNVNLASVTFNFDQPMQENLLQLGCTFVANNTSTQCGAGGSGYFDIPAWSNNGTTATFERKGGAFLPATFYRLEIVAAQSANGTPLADTTVTFNTAELPKLVSSSPANNTTDVPVNTDLVFTFNVPIQKDSFNLKFDFVCKPGAVCPEFDVPVWRDGDRTVFLKSKRRLEVCTMYPLSLSAKDTAGQALPPISISFITEPPAGSPCA